MSAYGGYQKTSYGAQGADDSGGFFAGGSQQGSQGGGGGGGKGGFQNESLRPLTIKQILDAEEAYAGAEFKVDGQTITQVTFVGQVRSVNPQPTNLALTIDDGTGQIDVKKWIDADKQGDADPGLEIDSHVRVWGRLKSFSGKRHVGATLVRPVKDFNEVNYHMLEATYVHLYYTKGPLGQQGQNGDGGGDSMFVDGGGYDGNVGGNGQASSKLAQVGANGKKMFSFMSGASAGNEGIHLDVIKSSTGMSVRDVMNAADDLLGQGLIYTTVDEETWAILDY